MIEIKIGTLFCATQCIPKVWCTFYHTSVIFHLIWLVSVVNFAAVINYIHVFLFSFFFFFFYSKQYDLRHQNLCTERNGKTTFTKKSYSKTENEVSATHNKMQWIRYCVIFTFFSSRIIYIFFGSSHITCGLVFSRNNNALNSILSFCDNNYQIWWRDSILVSEMLKL